MTISTHPTIKKRAWQSFDCQALEIPTRYNCVYFNWANNFL